MMSLSSTFSPSRPSPFAVFRRPSFALLWTAEFISTMGSGLTSIAASILVFRLTASALSVGLMLMATAVPSLFVGLIAGVFVDRWDRKRIMVVAQLIRAALIALVPLLLQWGVAWLYVIVMLSSAVGQFYQTAQASVLPELAPDDELAAGNSLMTISNIGALTVGFAGAGLIATLYSVDWAFYLDPASFLVAGLCIMLVQMAPLTVDDRTDVATIGRNLRAGFAFVRDTPVLRSLFFVFLPMLVAFGLNNALLLPFSTEALGASDFDYSVLEGLFTIGFVAGSLLMARLADRLHEGQWIAASLIGMALATIGLALTRSMPVAIACCLTCGMLNAPSYIGRNLLIQRNTTREIRGRVSSTFLVARDAALMLGLASAGLADLVDVRVLLLSVAGVMLGCGLLTLALPGLGQPTAEWRRVMTMLRAGASAPGLGLGRAALPADIDRLVLHVPELGALSPGPRKHLARATRVYDVPAGTVIVRRAATGDAAYVLLDGRTVARRDVNGVDQVLEVHSAGDFFGELAALTSVPRTADVIAEQPTTLLQVPAITLRHMMAEPPINRLFLTKMTERMVRMSMVDLPRIAAVDLPTRWELSAPARGEKVAG